MRNKEKTTNKKRKQLEVLSHGMKSLVNLYFTWYSNSMVSIEIGNSYSQIKGMTSQQEKDLRKVLSYLPNPKAAYFSGGYNKPRYLIDKKGFFPTGLVELVMTTIKEYVAFDKRVKPYVGVGRMFKFNSKVTPYDWQVKALDKAVKYNRGGIQAVTGSGKSLVIALIASRLNVRTLVVVPSLEIKKQLQESFKSLFGDNKNIVVENIDSKALKTATNFDCLIVDEAHHSAAKTYRMLNKTAWKDIYYRFFLTATFYRNEDHEKLLFEGIAGQLIYKLTYKEALRDNVIVPVEAYYVDLPKQETDAYTWAQVYRELVTENPHRNAAIANILDSLEGNGVPTLCLVKEIKHGEVLSEMSGIPFANGKDDESRDFIRQFNSGEIKSLIGTVGVLGEGIDTRPAEYIVIAGLGKAKSAFMQNIGRGLRKYPGKESAKVIIFRDVSHKFTLRHFNTQQKILLEEFAIRAIKLEEV